MAGTAIGTVEGLFRHPVKSMRGERLDTALFGEAGVVGDRVYALRERQGRIITAKRTRELLAWSASLGPQADPGDRAARITAPDGTILDADDPAVSEMISQLLDRKVLLEKADGSTQLFGELDADTIFAGIPIADALEGKARSLPADADRYDLAPGTFFDSADLHLLTTGTLDHLRTLIGSDADTDVRRFRPNVLISTEPDAVGFVEDAWMDGRLQLGGTVEVHRIWPTLRCVMTTVAQSEIPRDLRVLKAIVREHETNLGAFASVAVAGIVRVGDPVSIID